MVVSVGPWFMAVSSASLLCKGRAEQLQREKNWDRETGGRQQRSRLPSAPFTYRSEVRGFVKGMGKDLSCMWWGNPQREDGNSDSVDGKCLITCQTREFWEEPSDLLSWKPQSDSNVLIRPSASAQVSYVHCGWFKALRHVCRRTRLAEEQRLEFGIFSQGPPSHIFMVQLCFKSCDFTLSFLKYWLVAGWEVARAVWEVLRWWG